jgi:hypothetical protein
VLNQTLMEFLPGSAPRPPNTPPPHARTPSYQPAPPMVPPPSSHSRNSSMSLTPTPPSHAPPVNPATVIAQLEALIAALPDLSYVLPSAQLTQPHSATASSSSSSAR